MTTDALSALTLQRLQRIATPTLCTVLLRKGLRNVFLQGPRPVRVAELNMVGPAFTLRLIPAREDLDTPAQVGHAQQPHRRAIEECPAGHVLVIDSRGDARAASAGDILIARLRQRGCAGIVTDGGFRDAAQIAAIGLPAYHRCASAPSILTHHHPADLQQPIACGDVAVYPGDTMVGDADGVVCIPRHLTDEVAELAWEQTAYEAWVMEQIEQGRSPVGIFPLTDAQQREAFARWRAARPSG